MAQQISGRSRCFNIGDVTEREGRRADLQCQAEKKGKERRDVKEY